MTISSSAARRAAATARALIVLAASGAYFIHVFGHGPEAFLKSSLGGWIDPYFLNFLLEHWRHSLLTLTDPSVPPWFFPAHGTLGYSCALILYAPFYILARSVLDPLPAYTTTIFLVIETGTLCLYAVFRRLFRLTFLEALALTALLATSRNVITGETGAWAQRASIFLIPPIALLTFAAARMTPGRARLVMAWLSGLLTTLLFTQDAYTALLATLVAGLSLAVVPAFTGLRPIRERLARAWRQDRPFVIACAGGAAFGVLIFLRIYLHAYREHRAFPDVQLLTALTDVGSFDWRHLSSAVLASGAYNSLRTFALVFLCGALVWVPWFRVSRAVRLYALWFLLVSAIVLLVPLRFDDATLWRATFAHLPGFGAIRDPKRIVFAYELAAACALGLLLTRLRMMSPLRVVVVLLTIVLVVADRNKDVFDYERLTVDYDRWVAAPIRIDPSCRSFFIKQASDQYIARSGHQWSLYAVDSMFVSLNHSLPTLNGYSAWWPPDWSLADPSHPLYLQAVDIWIELHHLDGVCAFDIDARTMTPWPN